MTNFKCFFGQNFVFYKLLVDFCTLWTLGNHSKLYLKRWVIWNVILKYAGCSNGLIVNTQLTAKTAFVQVGARVSGIKW